MGKTRGLLERLAAGETIIVAEGYLLEFEARGYLKAGGFVPEVVLEHPELVRQLHEEFVHAGSDVVLAFTYYGHREKLRLIGREDDLEKMNRRALKIAREVADKTGTLMAGNLSNSTVYKPDDPENHKEIYEMCAEQVKWAVDGGADYIVAETYDQFGEAILALRAIKDHGKGLPAVVTYSVPAPGKNFDGQSAADACRALEEAGADVVGLNCARGPELMIPMLKEVREACKGPIAALPVVYRTNEREPVFYGLTEVDNPEIAAFPTGLCALQCSRRHIEDFTLKAKELGVQYMGLCCGNRAIYMRTMAETLGRSPAASKYSPDMSLHYSRIKDDRHSHTQSQFVENYKTNAD